VYESGGEAAAVQTTTASSSTGDERVALDAVALCRGEAEKREVGIGAVALPVRPGQQEHKRANALITH
jgi:hypothetical protein